MRRILIAVPFLIIGLAYLLMDFNEASLVTMTLNWLTFMLEYRYGGESREAEELVAFGVSGSSVLLPLHPAFAEGFAVFMFAMEMAGLFARFRLASNRS